MKKRIPTWGVVIIIVVIVAALLFLVPYAVNEAYKTGTGYITLWPAADTLSYYGMIIAALGAAGGVFFSIKYSHKQYEEDTRKRVLPYIAVHTLGKHFHRDLFDMNPTLKQPEKPDTGYYEYKLERVYFVIYDDRIEAVKQLSSDQLTLIESDGKIWIDSAHGVKTLVQKDYVSIPLEIENVGNGTAVGFRVGLNKEQERKSKLLLPRALKQGQHIYTHIFSSEPIERIKGKYVLELYYQDIYGTDYVQNYPVEIGVDNGGKKFSSIDLLGKQELISKSEDTTNADA